MGFPFWVLAESIKMLTSIAGMQMVIKQELINMVSMCCRRNYMIKFESRGCVDGHDDERSETQ